MPIVSYPGVGYYPAMVADVINAAWDKASERASILELKINELTDPITGTLAVSEPPHVIAGTVSVPTITPPNVTIGDVAAVNIFDEFNTQYLELVALLADKFELFQTTYFPDDLAFYTQAEDWLQAALADPSGLPANVRAQLLGDAQAIIITETNRAKDAVLATFATRRMPMPGGQAASAVLQLEQGAQDKMAAAARDITKNSVEQLRFDIEKAINCRTVAMSTAGDYVKALASGPDMASRLIGVGYDAQSKMVSAAAQFYGAQTTATETISKIAQYNNTTNLEAQAKNQAADISIIDNRIKAMLSEIAAVAQMATSLYNNIHASAGVAANASDSTTRDLTTV